MRAPWVPSLPSISTSSPSTWPLTFLTLLTRRLHPSHPSLSSLPPTSLLSFCPFYTDFPSLFTTPHPPIPGSYGHSVLCKERNSLNYSCCQKTWPVKTSSRFPHMSSPWTRDTGEGQRAERWDVKRWESEADTPSSSSSHPPPSFITPPLPLYLVPRSPPLFPLSPWERAEKTRRPVCLLISLLYKRDCRFTSAALQSAQSSLCAVKGDSLSHDAQGRFGARVLFFLSLVRKQRERP